MFILDMSSKKTISINPNLFNMGGKKGKNKTLKKSKPKPNALSLFTLWILDLIFELKIKLPKILSYEIKKPTSLSVNSYIFS